MKLDQEAHRDLLRLERTVTANKNTWITVGRALFEIQSRKLYKEFFRSFSVYCEQRLNISRQHGYRLASASEVVDAMPERLKPLLDTESKARELVNVPDEAREDVLQVAVEAQPEGVTAAGIAQAAAEVAAKPEFDSVGRVIPPSLMGYWNRRSEVQELLNSISRIKSRLKLAQDEKDLMYAEVNFSAALGDLEKAWTSIQCAKPHAVCTVCQGHPDTQPDGHCRLCLGRGLISKFRWDRLVPEEIKKVVEMGRKQRL